MNLLSKTHCKGDENRLPVLDTRDQEKRGANLSCTVDLERRKGDVGSKQGHMGDALASAGEEGRDKLR